MVPTEPRVKLPRSMSAVVAAAVEEAADAEDEEKEPVARSLFPAASFRAPLAAFDSSRVTGAAGRCGPNSGVVLTRRLALRPRALWRALSSGVILVEVEPQRTTKKKEKKKEEGGKKQQHQELEPPPRPPSLTHSLTRSFTTHSLIHSARARAGQLDEFVAEWC